MARERQWRNAVRAADTYYAAPDVLRQRVRAMVRRPSATRARSNWPDWRIAASLLLSAALTYVTTWSSTELMEQEVVASHVRSLQMDHVTDVNSSDQHRVKPWFHGKLDYAPAVEDFAAEGFPLLGGRPEDLDHRSVAALVYRYEHPPINAACRATGLTADARAQSTMATSCCDGRRTG